jgi:maltokinase
VAELHVALATPSAHFPSPRDIASKTSIQEWHARALASVNLALALTDGPEGERLKALVPQAIAAVAELDRIDTTPIQPIHGDLHVGQVLRWSGGYAINDFDGNPVLPPAERLAAQPVARDVAGMLQSLDHVGRVALRHAADADPIKVETWIRESRQRFLRTYRLTLAVSNNSELLDERLLTAFAVEQECREYVYAARHLPRWLYVPDAALPALLG